MPHGKKSLETYAKFCRGLLVRKHKERGIIFQLLRILFLKKKAFILPFNMLYYVRNS